MYLSTYLPVYHCLPTHWSIDLWIYLSIDLSICLSVCPSVSLFVYLSVCLFVYLSACLSVSLSIPSKLCIVLFLCCPIPLYLYPYYYLHLYLFSFFYLLSLCYLSTWKEAILQDLFQKWRLAGPKQSNSARLVLKKKSGTTKFCETSSIFEIDSSEAVVFLPFSPPNMLRATAACTVWTAQLPKVLRQWSVLTICTSKILEACFAPQQRALFRQLHFQKCSDVEVFFRILTSKCASRHSGVQFLVSHPTRWLHFSEPTFRPFGATKHWKNRVITVFRNFLPFGTSWSSFYWLSLVFYFFLFCHLCCFICPYCRKCYFKTFFHWSNMQ